jgi:hypothetical protein
MKTKAEIDAFFESEKQKFKKIHSQMNEQTKSYDLERTMEDYTHSFGNKLYQFAISPDSDNTTDKT